MKIKWKNLFPYVILFLIFFALPFEHKYDKVFRFYSLTLIPTGLVIPESFDKKIYFYPSDILSILLFGIGLIQMRGRFFQRGGLFLVAIFVFAICSIAASPFARYSLAYIRLWQLFTPMALFLFLANGPVDAVKSFKLFCAALFSSGLMQASIAISQYFLQRSLGLRILSECRLFATIPSTPSRQVCLFDQVRILPEQEIYRAMGTLSHPNVLGGFFVLTLLITMYLFHSFPRWRIRLGLAYAVQLFAMATTYSRAAIYALVVGTLIYLAWTWVRQGLLARAPLFLFLASFSLVGTLFYEQYVYRGGIVSYNACSRNSDSLRVHYQRVALRMTGKSPWLGVGYGRFSCASAPFLDQGADPNLALGGVHNIYMRLAAETGIFSLGAFLSWILLLLRAAWKAAPSLERALLFSSFTAFLFIGCCDHYPILFQQGALMFFSIAGMLARYGRFDGAWKRVEA